jgi:hypothetical protein
MKTNGSTERGEVVWRDIGIDRADNHICAPFRSFIADLMARQGH